ncbi:hypothetical protein V2G26_016777 [Clonostachys chloroleuca]
MRELNASRIRNKPSQLPLPLPLPAGAQRYSDTAQQIIITPPTLHVTFFCRNVMPHHGQAPSPPLGGNSLERVGFQWTSRLAMESRKRIPLPPVAWQPNRQVSPVLSQSYSLV